MSNEGQASKPAAPLSLERCLQTWGMWERGYRGGPQPVKVASWGKGLWGRDGRGDETATGHLTSSDKWIAQHVSKSVEALPRRDWQLVLEIEYIFHGNSPRVWRSNRLPRDAQVLAALLEDARVAVEPILRKRIGVKLA